MKSKEIFLLILIIVAGVIFYHAQTGKIQVNLTDIDWGEGIFFDYEEFVFEERQVIEPPFPAELYLVNAHGHVEIQGTDESKIIIALEKKILRRHRDEAQKVADLLKITISKGIDYLKISTNREEFKKKNFETHFRISLPEGMDIRVENSYGLVKTVKAGKADIRNRHGQVIARDIGRSLVVKNSYENVEVENIQSDCQIESKHSSITAIQIKGKTSITHRHGKVRLENLGQGLTLLGSHTEVFGQGIAGPAEVETSYERVALFDVASALIRTKHAPVELTGVKSQVEIANRHGRVKLADIQGNLRVEGKNLRLTGERITAEEIFISSSYESVELRDFRGKTRIILFHGNVRLEPAPLTHPLEVTGNYTDIVFIWPRGETYPLEARTHKGDIWWGLPASPSFQEKNDLSVIKAFSEEKDKPSIFLSTRYGKIKIEG